MSTTAYRFLSNLAVCWRVCWCPADEPLDGSSAEQPGGSRAEADCDGYRGGTRWAHIRCVGGGSSTVLTVHERQGKVHTRP
jgi:hypothetical protein